MCIGRDTVFRWPKECLFSLLCFVYYACTWGFSPLLVLTVNYIPYQKNISKRQGKPIRLKLLEVECYIFNIAPHMWLKAKNMEKNILGNMVNIRHERNAKMNDICQTKIHSKCEFHLIDVQQGLTCLI